MVLVRRLLVSWQYKRSRQKSHADTTMTFRAGAVALQLGLSGASCWCASSDWCWEGWPSFSGFWTVWKRPRSWRPYGLILRVAKIKTILWQSLKRIGRRIIKRGPRSNHESPCLGLLTGQNASLVIFFKNYTSHRPLSWLSWTAMGGGSSHSPRVGYSKLIGFGVRKLILFGSSHSEEFVQGLSLTGLV